MADILVSADDSHLASKLSETLALMGYRVQCVTHPRELVTTALSPPDVLLLSCSGLSRLRRRAAEFRHSGEGTRIPVLAAVDEDLAPQVAEDPNIDEFVVLPVSAAELRARTEALLARPGAGQSTLQADGLVVDRASRQVTVDGRAVTLTRKEFELLVLLMTHKGRTLSRRVLLREVWNSDVSPTRTVDVHVSRLRTKLGATHGGLIHTVRQTGYVFERDPNRPPEAISI